MTDTFNVERLSLARTARTYPVDARALLRAIEEAVHRLPRWDLERPAGDELRAVRRAGPGLGVEVKIHLAPLESGDHTNTLASFEVRVRAGLPWAFGRGKRSLDELLAAVDANLKPET